MKSEIKLNSSAEDSLRKKLRQTHNHISDTCEHLRLLELSSKNLKYANIGGISQTRSRFETTAQKLNNFEAAYNNYTYEIERFDLVSSRFMQNVSMHETTVSDADWAADMSVIAQNLLDRLEWDSPDISIWNQFLEAVKNSVTAPEKVTGTGINAFLSALAVYGAKTLSSPIFKRVVKGSTTMVKILNSPQYSGGRGGLRYINEKYLLNRTDAIGKAYRFDQNIAKAKNGLIILGGVLSFAVEYNKGEDLPQTERIVNAAVEGAWSVGTAVAIGAAVGSIVPGAGTIVGAAVGFAVGTVATVVIDGLVNAKWFDDGQKSAMDYMKQGANAAVNAITDTAVSIGNTIAEVGANIGNAVASWFRPPRALSP